MAALSATEETRIPQGRTVRPFPLAGAEADFVCALPKVKSLQWVENLYSCVIIRPSSPTELPLAPKRCPLLFPACRAGNHVCGGCV